jgi:hypothetical protein
MGNDESLLHAIQLFPIAEPYNISTFVEHEGVGVLVFDLSEGVHETSDGLPLLVNEQLLDLLLAGHLAGHLAGVEKV